MPQAENTKNKSSTETDPPADLPYTLARRGIYILPTRHGMVFLAILAGMLMGSINYNNNLGFLLTFLLGSVAFVSILHTYKNLSGIRIVSGAAKPVFAGNDAELTLTVRAPERPRCAVGFKFAEGPYIRRDLGPDADNHIVLPIRTLRRGLLRPGALTVFSRYPLGLFYAWSRFKPNVHFIVYPRPMAAPFRALRGESAATDEEVRSRNPGADDFEGLRTYQPGDSMQHISWKAYSRGMGLMTKQFVGPAGSSPILDWDLLSPAETESRLSMLSHMVLQAGRMNTAFGLRLPGRRIEPDKGEIHKHICLKALALHGAPGEEGR